MRGEWFAGARAGLPVVLGYLSIGFAAGVVQRAAGMSVAEVMLLSLVLYAGSAQFVVASLVAAAVSPATAIVTVFFVNLRHLLLASALAPHCRHFPAWQNALIGAQLTDETFVIAWGRLMAVPAVVTEAASAQGATTSVGASARTNAASLFDARWMLGLNLSAYLAWALANFAGALVGDSVGSIRALGFDFALAAMFGALLVLQLAAQARAARLAGLVVAALAALLSVTATLVLLGNWNILIATLLAATAGLFLQQWKSANTSC